MQKRLGILGIFLIVLMFVFSSGFVFADDKFSFNTNYNSNKVGWKFTDLDFSNNELSVSFVNDWENRDNCSVRVNSSGILSHINTFYINSQYRGLYLVTIITDLENYNKFTDFYSAISDDEVKLNYEKSLDRFVLRGLRTRGIEDNEAQGFFRKYEVNNKNISYNFRTLNNLNISKIDVQYIDGDLKKGQTFTKKINYSNSDYMVNFYLVDHCGRSASFSSSDDLFNDSKDNLAKSSLFIGNVPLILTNEILDNKIKLSTDRDENISIFYVLNQDLNLEDYFWKKFKDFDFNKQKLIPHLDKDINLNLNGIRYYISKYDSEIDFSNDTNISAIAVDYKNLTLSNYIDNLKLESGEKNSGSSEKSESSQSSSQSSSSNKFSINFKEDKKTDNVICEKETKICYYNNWSNIDVVVKKAFNDKPVYFSINELTIDYTDKFSIENAGELSSNQISLGTGNYLSKNTTEFTINNNIKNNYFLAAGQIGSNVDYLFFVYVEDFNQIVEYKILQKIVNEAYCTTFDCKIPDWMPYNILTPAYQDPVCEEIIKDDGKVEKESCKSRKDPELEFSCDVYVSNLRKNLNIFDLTQKHTDDRIYGDILTSQINNITINPNNQSKFNNVVLDVSKGYNFTDEETVQFISILAQESTFGTKVEGGLNEFGFAQIHYDAWFGDSTKISNGKNQLKSYFEIILNNKNSLSDETIKNITTTDALYDYVKKTIDDYKLNKSPDNLNKMNYATTVFGGAIYLYNRDQILNNGNNFPKASFSTYDDKDSIDALFASASKYVTPKTGFNIKATMIAGGLITHDNALKTIYKMAYYLSYKKYICETKNNFFNIPLNKSVPNTTSTSTNVNLSGVLPVKKNLTDEQIKNRLLGKTEYQNYCATFAREAGNYIFNYSPPLQSNNAWYFGESNQVILKVDNETEINPNNLVPGSILGIKIGDKDFYDTKEDGRLTNLPYTHVALYVGDFNGQRNVVFDGGWTYNNVKSFYKTFDQYFKDHPTYDLKEVILPKGSVTNEQKAYLSECIKSKTKTCEYYT